MSATLVVHQPNGDRVFKFPTVKELGEKLVAIFQDSVEPKGLTMIVGPDDNGNEMTVRVGCE